MSVPTNMSFSHSMCDFPALGSLRPIAFLGRSHVAGGYGSERAVSHSSAKHGSHVAALTACSVVQRVENVPIGIVLDGQCKLSVCDVKHKNYNGVATCVVTQEAQGPVFTGHFPDVDDWLNTVDDCFALTIQLGRALRALAPRRRDSQ